MSPPPESRSKASARRKPTSPSPRPLPAWSRRAIYTPAHLSAPRRERRATPILQIVNDRRLRLVVPIPEAQLGTMKAGQLVSFTVPAYPGQTFKAPIARIAEALDVKSRTMPVELDVVNREGRLPPGSFATVKWPLDRGYPTLFVPTTAVTNDQQHTFVIRVRNGKAEWVTVQTGQTVNTEVEVFGDLAAGDQVIKVATDAIHSGDLIRAQTAPR